MPTIARHKLTLGSPALLAGLLGVLGCGANPVPGPGAAAAPPTSAVAPPAAVTPAPSAADAPAQQSGLSVVNLGVSETVITGRLVRAGTNGRVGGAFAQVRGVGREIRLPMEGYFVVMNLPAGIQVLDVRHPLLGETSLSVEMGARGRLIGPQPGPGGRIVGQVRSASGQPLSDVQLVTEWEGLPRVAQSRVDGSFLIDRVPPGVYTLTAERLGLSSLAKQLTVSDNAQTEIFFELESRPLVWPAPVP